MPQRDLVWAEGAVRQLGELLDRRNQNNRAVILDCVEGHLLAVADDPSLSVPHKGPQLFRLYRFRCDDGDTALYLQAELQELADGSMAVIGCGTIRF